LPDQPNAARGTPPKLEPVAAAANGETIFQLNPGIAHPVAISTPDPKYDEFARRAGVQGTTVLAVVVGSDGNVSDVQVARPLGMGLDEKAVEAVRAWRFRPAMKDGQPVTVQINVEVNFRLY
jgi:TonB family protein